MSPIVVTPKQIRDAAYGVTIPSDADTAVQRLIDKAIQRLRVEIPGFDARVQAGALPAELVQGVVEDMVIRVLRNPNGYRQITIEDYSRTIDSAVSSGELTLTAAERALLSPKTAAGRPGGGRIGSIRVNIPSWRLP